MVWNYLRIESISAVITHGINQHFVCLSIEAIDEYISSPSGCLRIIQIQIVHSTHAGDESAALILWNAIIQSLYLKLIKINHVKWFYHPRPPFYRSCSIVTAETLPPPPLFIISSLLLISNEFS